MGSKSKTLHDLLVHQLRDLHYAERHGGKLLGKLAKAAVAGDVKAALEGFAQQSHTQVDHLDAIFDKLDKKSQTVPCEAMQGIIEEAKDLLHDFEDSEALDAGLIAAAVAVAHYGIARCSSVRVWCRQLELDDTLSIVESMLGEKRRQLEMLERLTHSTRPATEGAASERAPLTLKTAALSGLG